MGFLWWAMPAYWKTQGLAVDRIATLTAILVLPWTLKWLWAPLIDRTSTVWPYRRWVISAQAMMGLTLIGLPLLDPNRDTALLTVLLLAHAVSAATQDVSIDAMCISSIERERRGRINGWMQAGLLLGRALFGGGALLLIAHTSLGVAVASLVAVLWSTAMLLAIWSPRRRNEVPPPVPNPTHQQVDGPSSAAGLAAILGDQRIWLAFAFALVGGTAFEGVGALLGPFLVESGVALESVGAFQLGPLAGALAIGALLGGRLADRFGHTVVAMCSLTIVAGLCVALGTADAYTQPDYHALRLGIIVALFAVVGTFTASSYALFMDLSTSRWKGTLFSAFMGATNACEAGSAFVAGQLAVNFGFPATFTMMIVPSLVGVGLLLRLRSRD